jgi:hypothetical protein
MWPANWINDEVQLQALLSRWRNMPGTLAQIWEYSCSHDRLLVRMVCEKESRPIASAYVFCRGCESVRFDPAWRGVNIEITKEAGALRQVVVSDPGRLHVVCGSASVIETAVMPFIHLGDELKGLSSFNRRPVKRLRSDHVMIFVSGNTPEETTQRIGEITETSKSYGGMIGDILYQVVVVSFIDLLRDLPMRDKRLALVEHLNRAWPGQLKMVHGATEARDGKFDVMLGKLELLELGQIEELGT